MEPDGTQQSNGEKDGEDDYRHSGVLSCCIQNTPLAHSVQCTFHGRCPLLREEGYASGENEQDHLGQPVPMVERSSERQLL